MLIGAHLDRSHVEPVSAVVPIDLDRVILSAAEIARDRSSSDPLLMRNVLEARESLLDLATFIAIRWGTVVDSVDSAREKCATRIPSWRKRLEDTQGLVEMTFKIGGRGKPGRPDFQKVSGGREYLEKLHEMRRGMDVDTDLLEKAETIFAPLSVETKRLRREDGGAEIALLVARDQVQHIAEAGHRLGDENPDRPFLLSGPWPLETFAE